LIEYEHVSNLKVIIAGMGVQGAKRLRIAGDDAVATVDPFLETADYKTVQDVPLESFDAALCCVPDDPKQELIDYLLENGKHVLVEKPLPTKNRPQLERLAEKARSKGLVCYTAYNHRFEPHFVQMKELLDSGRLGEIYSIRMFYGNGTARLVRDSEWRDEGAGVLPDLGSHLLDTLNYWTGEQRNNYVINTATRFENRAFDHVTITSQGRPLIQLEMTLLMWRNHFYADVLAENGSAHISSLCKWGPSTFSVRDRLFPSGRPEEHSTTLVKPDPTWAAEYAHFKNLIANGDVGNTGNDLWINDTLNQLSADALEQWPDPRNT
jgi:predicted dehydrogenase